MQFKPVLDILRDEMYKTGGRMFAEEVSNQALSHMSDTGSEDAATKLKLQEFTKKLLGHNNKASPDEVLFDTLLNAMAVLSGSCSIDELEELGLVNTEIEESVEDEKEGDHKDDSA